MVDAPGGRRLRLEVGDLIGRMPTAALSIDDLRVSEAHALVSLRAGGLHLLSLRRPVVIGGQPVWEVRLCGGQVIELAADLRVSVVDVHAPCAVLAIELPGHAPCALPSVTSVLAEPLRIVPSYVPGASLHLWEAGGAWRAQPHGDAVRPLAAGDRFEVGGARVTITTIPALDGPPPPDHASGVAEPLRVICHGDVVELQRHHRPPVWLGGKGARILCELVACAGPMHWSVLAGELWPAHGDDLELRHRWDVALHRLRGKLRAAGVRGDLLRADHSGQLTLVLYDGDAVEDRS